MTRSDNVQALVDLAVERFGRLDAFVANAGVAVNAPLAAGDFDDWNHMIECRRDRRAPHCVQR